VQDWGILERSIIYHNHEAGGPCAYGTGWAEVWNSVFYSNGWDTSVQRLGDISVAIDNNHLAVYNSISQRSSLTTKVWDYEAPHGNTAPSLCPISDYNLYVPLAANSEQLADFNCTGNGTYVAGARSYASPPAFIGAHDKVGSGFTTGFTATNESIWANNDFHLHTGSSAIDAGTYMFHANGAGTNATTITVVGNGGDNDPRDYFISPTSYLNATADTIQIVGCGVVTITNMTATMITFTPACSWADGAGVHLPWAGSAPDMGAFEYGLSSPGGPSPPTLISAQVW
jgi:hypothetical protein